MVNKSKINSPMCACGTGKTAEKCCLAVISTPLKAKTPAQLMRSRYVAYTLGDTRYLIDSWHSSTRPVSLKLDEKLVWAGLKLVKESKVVAEGLHWIGYVEFMASFTRDGAMGQVHERSRFLFEDGLWFYVDGEQIETGELYARRQPGRNDPCFCGSGKKFKKCCG